MIKEISKDEFLLKKISGHIRLLDTARALCTSQCTLVFLKFCNAISKYLFITNIRMYVVYAFLCKTFAFSSYSFRSWIVSSIQQFLQQKQEFSLLSRKLKFCGNNLNWLQFPNSRKNCFRGNCMRKYGKWFCERELSTTYIHI